MRLVGADEAFDLSVTFKDFFAFVMTYPKISSMFLPRFAAISDGEFICFQTIERGAPRYTGLARANNLGQNVVHADRLEHRAHRTASNNAGTLRRPAASSP